MTTTTHHQSDLSDAVRDLVTSAASEPTGEHETALSLARLACRFLPYDEAGIVLVDRDGQLRTAAWTDPHIGERVESDGGSRLHGIVSLRLAEPRSPHGVLHLCTTSAEPVTTEGLEAARRFAHEVSVALRLAGEVSSGLRRHPLVRQPASAPARGRERAPRDR